MKEIKLFNRDGANLRLVKMNDKNPGIWNLIVDKKHKYIFEYMRIIGKEGAKNMRNPSDWDAIDPSGGPFISLGSEFENKYKVVGFINATTLIISENEGNNN